MSLHILFMAKLNLTEADLYMCAKNYFLKITNPYLLLGTEGSLYLIAAKS